MKKITKENIFQFIKFGIVGFSNTIISYFTYAILTYLGMYYILASIIGFVISVLNSFFWNNKYVFKMKDGEKRSIFRSLLKTFISYAGTGLVLSNILLFLLVECLSISKYLAPLLSLVITIPLNYIVNKYWAFKVTKNSDREEISIEKN